MAAFSASFAVKTELISAKEKKKSWRVITKLIHLGLDLIVALLLS